MFHTIPARRPLVNCVPAEGQRFDDLVCPFYPVGNMFGMRRLDAAPVLVGDEE